MPHLHLHPCLAPRHDPLHAHPHAQPVAVALGATWAALGSEPAALPVPLLVLAVGNLSRGDDAVGPLLAERLSGWLAGPGWAWRDQVEVICDMQLMVEHVLDVQGRQRVLFVDAAASGSACIEAQEVTPASALGVSSHQCTPGQLLGLVDSTLHQATPVADLLQVKGEHFELGEGLSGAAHAGMEMAWGELMAWVATHAPRAPVPVPQQTLSGAL
jgi:hydrogenase maturation protease